MIIGATGGFLVTLIKTKITFRQFMLSIFAGAVLAPFTAGYLATTTYGSAGMINGACLIVGMLSVRIINGIDSGFEGVWSAFLFGLKAFLRRSLGEKE